MPLNTVDERLSAIAAGPKPNALVLDFAGLIRTHGPVDAVKARTPGNGAGVAPVKECPTCHSLIHASLRECPDCGHVFEPSGITKLTAKASAMAIMAEAPATWLTVSDRKFSMHHKPDKPASVMTRFKCGIITHKAWYAPARASKGHFYADRFWFEHGGDAPAPYTAEEWLERQSELRATAEIAVKPDGKYFKVDATKAASALSLAPVLV
jgi:DNA repair protein RadD